MSRSSEKFVERLAKLCEARRFEPLIAKALAEMHGGFRVEQLRLLARQLELEREASSLVESAYGLTEEERSLVRSTRPPRDPLDVLEVKIENGADVNSPTGRSGRVDLVREPPPLPRREAAQHRHSGGGVMSFPGSARKRLLIQGGNGSGEDNPLLGLDRRPSGSSGENGLMSGTGKAPPKYQLKTLLGECQIRWRWRSTRFAPTMRLLGSAY